MINKTTIQDLIDQYVEATIQKFQADSKEKKAIEDLMTVANTFEGLTVILEGTTKNIKIRKRVSNTYPKVAGEEHTLKKVLDEFPEEFHDFVRVSYSESGSRIQKLIDNFEKSQEQLTDMQRDLVTTLLRNRVTASGKPVLDVTMK